MSSTDKKKGSLKEKLFHEFVEYWINVCYLSLAFAAFIQYRRFVLAAHDITYTNYLMALIKAFIFAKVVMIGDALRIGRGLGHKPLIVPTFYKSVVFTLFVGAFTLIEYVIKGLWQGEGVTGGLLEFTAKGPHELLANCLILFVALFPFFAIKELGRVLGEGKIRALFFRKRDS